MNNYDMRTKDGYKIENGMWISDEQGNDFIVREVYNECNTVYANIVKWHGNCGDYTVEYYGMLDAEEIATMYYL